MGVSYPDVLRVLNMSILCPNGDFQVNDIYALCDVRKRRIQ